MLAQPPLSVAGGASALIAAGPGAAPVQNAGRHMKVALLFLSCTVFSFATDMLTKRILQTANAWDGLALGNALLHDSAPATTFDT